VPTAGVVPHCEFVHALPADALTDDVTTLVLHHVLGLDYACRVGVFSPPARLRRARTSFRSTPLTAH